MFNRIGNSQTRIEKFFDGRTVFPDNEPVFDFPLLIMGFTNRCGSNLLGEYLRMTGRFSGLHEHLNAVAVENMSCKTKATSFPDHVSALVESSMKAQLAFGIKASWDQILMLKRWRIDRMFSSTYILHVERADVLAQAISFSIADQTKRWKSSQSGSGAEPTYDYNDIKRRMKGIGSSNASIRKISAALRSHAKNVFYEDIVDNPSDVVAHINTWLGFPADDIDLGETKLRKQADEINVHFKTSFQKDAESEMMGALAGSLV